MQERQQFQERAGAVALGLLAEDMVRATGRVIRRDELRPHDRAAVAHAKTLFETLAQEDVVPHDFGVDRMLADDAYRDTLRALRLRVPAEETRAAAAELVQLLDALLAGELPEPQREQLPDVRAIFIDLGKSMLTRSNELARSQRETPVWRSMQPTSPF